MTELSEPFGLTGESRSFEDGCLDTFWRRQLAFSAGSPAVVSSERILTYEELARAVGALSAQLPEAEDVLRAIVSPKGWEQIVAVLGILASGGAYVPLELPLPVARVVDVLARTGADSLITDGKSSVWASQFGPSVYVIEPGLATAEPAWREQSRTSASVAYVTFTSGSTGVPKGVMISHRAAANTIHDINRTFDVGPADRTYMVSSLSFDLSVYDIFGPLVSGGAVVVPRPGGDRDPDLWLADIRDHEVTIWNSVPALMQLLVERMASLGASFPRSLRLIMLSGDWVPPALTRAIRELAPWVELAALGGATEAAIWSVIHRVDERDASRDSVPYGRPLANQAACVLDGDLFPCAPGEAGDLFIAGAGLAEGYFGDPEQTAHSFVFHPLTGERLYRTGDRARLLAEGELEFLGRQDLQVKVHGYRIELGEVEAALRSHGAVETAIAAVLGGRWEDKKLLAAVTLKPGAAATGDEVREHLASRLPNYMVPRTCVVLPDLPLTANGKVDRSAIADELARMRPAGARGYALTELEEEITLVWNDLLGVDVSPDADFFEQGGTSLQAIRALARLRDQTGRDIPARAIFDAADLREFAKVVAEAPYVSAPLSPGDGGPAPLTFQQEGVWFLDKLVDGNRAYHFQCSIRFSGRLQVPLLEQALSAVVKRHEVLRTTIEEDEQGIPRQTVHPPFPIVLPVVDLRGRDAESVNSIVETIKQDEFGRRFDFSRLPLIHWKLLQLQDDEFLLLQVEHHFVHDGWSLSLLWHEVESIYQALTLGVELELEELPLQYAEYARRQRAPGEEQFVEGIRHWVETLDGAPPLLELPGAKARPKRQRFLGNVYRGSLPGPLVEATRELARTTGSSLFAVCFAGFLTLLHRYVERRDLVVATTVANRPSEAAQRLIGMFVNTVAIRQTLEPEASFSALVSGVRETFLASLPYHSVPFDRVVRALDVPPNLGRNPVVQVAFSFHDSPMADLKLPGAQGALRVESNGSAKFDLSVIVIPSTAKAPSEVLWEFNTDIYDERAVETMHQHFVALLANAVADPAQSLVSIPFFGAADARVQAWPESEEAPVTTAVDMLEGLAQRHPEAPAIVAHDGRLTRAELFAAAEGIAAALRSGAVEHGATVAVCLRRGVMTPAAMLGTLLAGGAYFLLDPDHPQERLSKLIAAAAPPVVITTSELAARLPHVPRVLLIDGIAVAESDPVGSRPPLHRDDRAYVVATSGSTGDPKLIAATHGGLANLVQWTGEAYGVGEDDGCAQLASLSFDAATWETWSFLGNGATLHMPDDETRRSPAALIEWIAAERIDVAFLSTPLAEATMDLTWPHRPRVILTGGDKLRRRPPASYPKLSNCYGPAECTVVSTSLPIVPAGEDQRPITVGRPIRRTAAFVVDKRGELTPIGVPGELLIGGAGVACGYHRDPAATASRFQTLTLAGGKGRLYRTGDRVRYLADGTLEFLGRTDRQVKVRGVRIELGEVEAAIAQGGRWKGAVLASEDAEGTPQLHAYVELLRDQTRDPDAIREDLKTRLPREMIPATITVLDELPLSPAGKVDFSALPVPSAAAESTAKSELDTEAALSAYERGLLVIWRDVLERDDVGLDDDFFDLGGHSLLAAKIVVLARQQLDVSLPVVTLFETPTIRGLARALEVDATVIEAAS